MDQVRVSKAGVTWSLDHCGKVLTLTHIDDWISIKSWLWVQGLQPADLVFAESSTESEFWSRYGD